MALLGNTLRFPRAAWCFTINNPQPGDVPVKWKGVCACIFQLEQGVVSRTQHFQGYVVFDTKKSIFEVLDVCRCAHWEPAQGSMQDNLLYCSKDSTRVVGPFCCGKNIELLDRWIEVLGDSHELSDDCNLTKVTTAEECFAEEWE